VRIAIGSWAASRGRVECVGYFAPLLRAAFAATAGEASAYCGLLHLCNKLSALGRPLRPPEADILAYIRDILAGAENGAAAVPDDWGESARMEISRSIASDPEVATDVVLVATQVAEATDELLIALLARAQARVPGAVSGTPADEAAAAVLREISACAACDADEAVNVINRSRNMVADLTESPGSAEFAMSYACLEAWAARRDQSRGWTHLRFCD
jgi:hypothetical protein